MDDEQPTKPISILMEYDYDDMVSDEIRFDEEMLQLTNNNNNAIIKKKVIDGTEMYFKNFFWEKEKTYKMKKTVLMSRILVHRLTVCTYLLFRQIDIACERIFPRQEEDESIDSDEPAGTIRISCDGNPTECYMTFGNIMRHVGSFCGLLETNLSQPDVMGIISYIKNLLQKGDPTLVKYFDCYDYLLVVMMILYRKLWGDDASKRNVGYSRIFALNNEELTRIECNLLLDINLNVARNVSPDLHEIIL